MEAEITVMVDPYEVFDNLTRNQQISFLEDALDGLDERGFAEVLEAQDAERVISCYSADEICDKADEQELVDELTRRGWKLIEEDE